MSPGVIDCKAYRTVQRRLLQMVGESAHLDNLIQGEGASRDILLLDISLDNYFRLCIERTDKSQMSGDDLIGLVSLVLRNAVIANESRDLQQVMAYRVLSMICTFHRNQGHVLQCISLLCTLTKAELYTGYSLDHIRMSAIDSRQECYGQHLVLAFLYPPCA